MLDRVRFGVAQGRTCVFDKLTDAAPAKSDRGRAFDGRLVCVCIVYGAAAVHTIKYAESRPGTAATMGNNNEVYIRAYIMSLRETTHCGSALAPPFYADGTG